MSAWKRVGLVLAGAAVMWFEGRYLGHDTGIGFALGFGLIIWGALA